MTENPQPGKKQIKLHFPQNLSAVYANLAVMSTTRNEFVFDFSQMFPPDPRAHVQARVVMSPQHAKLVLNLLQRNIERYEAQHGTIDANIPPSLADELFKGVQPPDTGDDDDDPQ